MLLICSISENGEYLKLKLWDAKKPGFIPSENSKYLINIKTKTKSFTKDIEEGSELSLPVNSLKNEEDRVIIPKLFVKDTSIENLICISPVIYLK